MSGYLSKIFRSAAAVLLASAVTACGGGSAGVLVPTPAAPAAPPAGATARVVVTVVDDTGAPVSGARVSVSGLQAVTDASGGAEFSVLPDLGTFSAVVTPPGDHLYAEARNGVRQAGARTELRFTLNRRRTIVLLGARGVLAAGDGSRLDVDLDLAVLDPDGRSQVLSAGSLQISANDCGWGPADCAVGPGGRAAVGVGTFIGTTGVGEQPLPANTPAAAAAAVLVDRGPRARERDPEERRGAALAGFMSGEAAIPRALALFPSADPTIAADLLGPLVTDGTRYLTALATLNTGPAGNPPPFGAIARTASLFAGRTGHERRHVVVVTDGPWYADEPCTATSTTCRRSLDAAIADALTNGYRVTAICSGDRMADLALRTGGVYASVRHPSQYAPVVRALPPLLSGGLPASRVRFELRGDPGVFVTGGTVYGNLAAYVGTGQLEIASIAVPIG